MNGYLVQLLHTSDDLPVRLFATKEEAIDYAKGRKWKFSRKERDMFCVESDSPCYIDVIEFADGKPVEVLRVRTWITKRSKK